MPLVYAIWQAGRTSARAMRYILLLAGWKDLRAQRK